MGEGVRVRVIVDVGVLVGVGDCVCDRVDVMLRL